MAVDDDDQTPADPLTTLDDYEKKIALNRIILLVGAFLSLIVLVVLLTGMSVMFMRIADIAPAQGPEADAAAQAMEQRFAELESKLEALSDFRKGELRKVAEFTQQLEQVYAGCSEEKTAPFKALLAEREKNFQAFLKTMKSGTSNLSGMALGSKTWVQQHNASLDELISESAARQAKLLESN